MVIDEASRLSIAIPTSAHRALSSADAICAVTAHWVNWAGPPDKVQYDTARGFISVTFEQWLRGVDSEP
eukprot:1119729-Heterocapsa_arctica.AAC.1